MSHFSPRATQAIRDFVANLSMDDVTPASDGSYSFSFDRAGLLSFSPSADGKRAIMSLKSHEQSSKTAGDMRQFLSLAQHDPMTQTPISAGIAGNAFVLAANIPDSDFDLQKIELCLDRMIALHGSI